MAVRLLVIISMFFFTSSFAQTSLVYFDFNSTAVRQDARAALNKIAASKSTVSLGIFGHTDQMGSDGYNEWLSLERARSIRSYLLSKGLDSAKVAVVVGFGATRLISPGDDSMSRQLNRRVVLMNNYKPTNLDLDLARKQASITTKPGTEVVAAQPAQQPVTRNPGPPRVAVREEPIVKEQKSEKLIEDIKDKNTKAGENIVLRNINFQEGRHEFLATAFSALNDLLETMQKIPTLEIEIQGHVCCQDGEADALDVATGEMSLSFNRARAVYEFLVQKGIDKNRITYRGLAHKFPLVKQELTPADEIANRRVEIKIIKK